MPGVSSVEVRGSLTIITTAQAEATLREMLALDQHLHSLEVQSPLLEDAFLALTGSK
jgi:ABC-2 type transport system ATP-binding protein